MGRAIALALTAKRESAAHIHHEFRFLDQLRLFKALDYLPKVALQLLICEVDHLPTVATRDLLFVCQQFDHLHICLVAVRAMKLKTKLFGIDHRRPLARRRARDSDINEKPRR